MSPTKYGRHCASCEKTVVDFSRKTDIEIAAFLQENPSSCGRFLPHQLNRYLLLEPEPVKHYGFLKLAACAVISFGAFDSWSQEPDTIQNVPVIPTPLTNCVAPQDANNIRFQLSVSEEKLLEISTIQFKLGDFSINFDHFQNDTLIRFYVPQVVDWQEIEIFIRDKSGLIDTLTMAKSSWYNFIEVNERFLNLTFDQDWALNKISPVLVSSLPYNFLEFPHEVHYQGIPMIETRFVLDFPQVSVSYADTFHIVGDTITSHPKDSVSLKESVSVKKKKDGTARRSGSEKGIYYTLFAIVALIGSLFWIKRRGTK